MFSPPALAGGVVDTTHTVSKDTARMNVPNKNVENIFLNIP
jgi:hypothetical protein